MNSATFLTSINILGDGHCYWSDFIQCGIDKVIIN
jgi:hypothetical protein